MASCLAASSPADIALPGHQQAVFGSAPSDSTVRRALDELGELGNRARAKIAKARASVHARVWRLPAESEAGFPWVRLAGKVFAGWIVVDIDGTLITAHSKEEGAAATFKKGFGHHQPARGCKTPPSRW